MTKQQHKEGCIRSKKEEINVRSTKEIVDHLYSDFDWYSGKFSKTDKKWFMRYFKLLQNEVKGAA